MYVIESGGATDLAVSVTSPADGAIVSGSVTVTVAATGGSGDYTYQVVVDGLPVYAGSSASFDWDTTTVSEGTHRLTAIVIDSGNRTGSANVTVTVQNTPADLAVTFTSPPEAATLNGITTVVMVASGAAETSLTFDLALDGAVVSSETVTGTTAVYSWDTTTATDGPHTLTVTVSNGAGRTASATRAVTVANATGPLGLFITSPRAGATVNGAVAANLWVEGQSGSANTFTLMIDGAVIDTRTVPGVHVTPVWDTTTVANGDHVLSAAVTDETGNTGTAVMTVTVAN